MGLLVDGKWVDKWYDTKVNFEHIKQHYYRSHPTINPNRIVPAGPLLDLDEPHGRGDFSNAPWRWWTIPTAAPRSTAGRLVSARC